MKVARVFLTAYTRVVCLSFWTPITSFRRFLCDHGSHHLRWKREVRSPRFKSPLQSWRSCPRSAGLHFWKHWLWANIWTPWVLSGSGMGAKPSSVFGATVHDMFIAASSG